MYILDGIGREVRKEVVRQLKKIGIKHSIKSVEYKKRKVTEKKGIFKKCLEHVPKVKVKIQQYSEPVEVPAILYDMCEFLKPHITIEGIFRKSGSIQKKRQLKTYLNSGMRLSISSEHSAFNVANLIKEFLRDLAEPLIPTKLQPTLNRCFHHKSKVEALLLACLLLPVPHLNTLVYITQFLNKVSEQHHRNKMSTQNLATVFGPNIIPILWQDQSDPNDRNGIVQILIENSNEIGLVPEYIIEILGYDADSSSLDEFDSSDVTSRKRKKRGSSITSVFSGIKKFIKRSSMDSAIQPTCTPTSKASKARNSESASMSRVPGKFLAQTPRSTAIHSTSLTPKSVKPELLQPSCSTHLCSREQTSHRQATPGESSSRLLQRSCSTYFCSREQTSHRQATRGQSSSRLPEPTSSIYLQGASHQSGRGLSRSKLLSERKRENTFETEDTESENLAISFQRYNDIKERMNNFKSQLENDPNLSMATKKQLKALSEELGNLTKPLKSVENTRKKEIEALSEEHNLSGSLKSVENAYTQTVTQSDHLRNMNSPHLIRRISRELGVKESSERVVRSPSARRIGTIRRKSRENLQLKRQLSLNISDRPRSLKRGRPNTVLSGLPQPSSAGHSAEIARKSSAPMDFEEEHPWQSAEHFF